MVGSLLPSILLLLVIMQNQSTGQTCPERSNFGTQFTLAFPGQYDKRTDGTIELKLYSGSSGKATLSCTGFSNQTVTLSSNTMTYLSVHGTLRISDSMVSNKMCTLVSTVDIALYVVDTISDGWLSVDGYMALPDNVLSTDYVISEYPSLTSSKPEILVTCPSSCSVSITVSDAVDYSGIHYSAGENISVTLQSSSLHLVSTNDLSGTRIYSDNPVAVYAAHQCVEIPNGKDTCDFLLEQMIPVEGWGSQYIIPGLIPRLSSIIRVYAKRESASFQLHRASGGPATQYFIHNKTDFVEIQLNYTDTPAVIASQTPIGIVQYGMSRDVDHKTGGPFMTVVPSIGQFPASSVVGYEHKRSRYSYTTLVVTVLSSEVSDLSYSNNLQLRQSSPVPAPLSQYSVLYFNIGSADPVSLTSRSNQTRFGSMVYSGDSAYEKYSYGFPMSMSFPSTGCSTPTEIPTTLSTPTQRTPGPIPTTANPIPFNASSRQCFSCQDVSHLRYCNTIKTCKQDEVCFTSSYTSVEGHEIFRSGCIKQTSCSLGKKRAVEVQDLRTRSTPCFTCCNTDYCNSQGCGDLGFVSRSQRGPICLDCSHVGNPSECYQVTLCKSSQLCSVQEYGWGERDRTYTFGCKDRMVCVAESGHSARAITGRSVPVCSSCCTDDFCNRNCTALLSGGGQPLVG